MQAVNGGLHVVLEVVVLVSLALWGWGREPVGRWILAIGVPLAFALLWDTLVSRYSASKLDDPSRLRLEIVFFVCAVAASCASDTRSWASSSCSWQRRSSGSRSCSTSAEALQVCGQVIRER